MVGPLGPFHLVHVARFLKKRGSCGARGFARAGRPPAVPYVRRRRSPSSTHAVAPDELRRAFSSLEILRDDVEAIDDGRGT